MIPAPFLTRATWLIRFDGGPSIKLGQSLQVRKALTFIYFQALLRSGLPYSKFGALQGSASFSLNILLVEDDQQTLEFLRAGLVARGHAVDAEQDGRDGLLRACVMRYDILIIDRMLPGLDGLDLLKALRTSSVDTPVILLTAMGGLADRVEGLRGGADDYLVKPFELEELDARIEAIGRRPPTAAASGLLRKDGILLDRLARRVTVEGAPADLTSSEFAMLEMLLLNAGRSVTKTMLLEGVFDLQLNAPGPIIEPHMSRLRAKLVRLGAVDPIRTLRVVGYSIAAS
jgi:two-component system OmpR family response regulator